MTGFQLSTKDHSRNKVGLRYIYPVLSRRAGGISIGINFNVNNACNWRCIYCQVPDLNYGVAPNIDLTLLEEELKEFIDFVVKGNFFESFGVPVHLRKINDIAISGNGEPTSLKNFSEAVTLIGKVGFDAKVLPNSKFVLITNGSLMYRDTVISGLKQLGRMEGEVWFKVDSATREGKKLINNSHQDPERTFKHLLVSAEFCHTKIQTCLVDFFDKGLVESEKQAYLRFLLKLKQHTDRVQELMLYTIARPSLQPEAANLKPMSKEVMDAFAEEVSKLGYKVSVSL